MRGLAAQMGKVVLLGFEDQSRRQFTGLNILDGAQQEAAHLQNKCVAGADMLFAAVDDRPHAFGGAGVLVQELGDAGEIYRFLPLAILQVVVALVAEFLVAGVDEITLGGVFFD